MTDDILEEATREEDGTTPIPYDPFKGLSRAPKSWDLGVNYMKMKLSLEHGVRTEKNAIRYSNLVCLLIQLTNATRISETVEAFNKFLETGERDLQVRVRKKKVEELRRVRIPLVVEQRGKPRSAGAVKMFVARLGGNTHSLRYALVGYLSAVKKEPPQVIAKITHHSKLDMILKYTQQGAADNILDETAK